MQKNNYELGAIKRKLGIGKEKLRTGDLIEAAQKSKMKVLQTNREALEKGDKTSLAIKGLI